MQARLRGLLWTALVLLPALAWAQADAPAQPDPGEETASAPTPALTGKALLRTLLERVNARAEAERVSDREREARFQKALEEQTRLLEETLVLVQREEAQGFALDERFGRNELALEELKERLTQRVGQLGELFGVVRLVSTDLAGETWESLTSLGVEPRDDRLERLGRSKGLPSTEDMEWLWYELQREMTEQGRITRLSTPVRVGEDETVERSVVRVGPFVAISDVGYAQWEPVKQELRALDRQPPPRYRSTISSFLSGGDGFRRLAVDPSRGTLIEALSRTPTLLERVRQGGYVGYTILVLGALALLLGLRRLADLWLMGRRVEAQARIRENRDDNPLGRLQTAYETNRHMDTESLELKLHDALRRESSHIERHVWLVNTVSIIAPLLGLLGTVTGMIQTFQAITLVGAGDPKMMAGGISEALITTTLGLVVAIPLVLLAALLASRTRQIIEVLDERLASLTATSHEQEALAG